MQSVALLLSLAACGPGPFEATNSRLLGTWKGATPELRLELRFSKTDCSGQYDCYCLGSHRCYGRGTGIWRYLPTNDQGTGSAQYDWEPARIHYSADSSEIELSLNDLQNNVSLFFYAQFVGENKLIGKVSQTGSARKNPSAPPLAIRTLRTPFELLRSD